VLLRRALAGLPEVELVRRPICVPRSRGLMIADLLRGLKVHGTAVGAHRFFSTL